MQYLASFLLVFLFASCAGPAKTGPKPQIAPVRASNTQAITHIKSTSKKVDSASYHIEKVIVAIESDDCKSAKQDAVAAKQDLTDAHNEIGLANYHAEQTTAYAKTLETQIDEAYKRELEKDRLLAKYEPFWITGHKWHGIGGIIQGFAILMSHLLILLAFLLVCAILIRVFLPGLMPIFVGLKNGVKALFRK